MVFFSFVFMQVALASRPILHGRNRKLIQKTIKLHQNYHWNFMWVLQIFHHIFYYCCWFCSIANENNWSMWPLKKSNNSIIIIRICLLFDIHVLKLDFVVDSRALLVRHIYGVGRGACSIDLSSIVNPDMDYLRHIQLTSLILIEIRWIFNTNNIDLIR